MRKGGGRLILGAVCKAAKREKKYKYENFAM